MTGGGSGGHITPLLAVAAELKRLQPEVRIVYIGQRGDGLGDIPAADPNIDAAYTIRAGKFRRYHNEGLKQIFDVLTWLKNARDAVWVLVGLWQSYWLLGRLKPSVVFVKGGFVGVPVGLASAARKVPYVTHDSDATAGLANRIIARWAAIHAVSLPKDVYSYPAKKTVQVGVPVHGNYSPITPEVREIFRRETGLDKYRQILLVTGGGLGAQRVNEAVMKIVPDLLHRFEDLAVVQIAGRANEASVRSFYMKNLSPVDQGRVVVKGYVTDFYLWSGAADVVVARAGATNLAEFALQGKACLIVPNPYLTGGHQLKNAAYLEEQGAAAVVTEQALDTELQTTISDLLNNYKERVRLGKNLAKFAVPDAAHRLAVLLLKEAKQQTL